MTPNYLTLSQHLSGVFFFLLFLFDQNHLHIDFDRINKGVPASLGEEGFSHDEENEPLTDKFELSF